MFDPANHAHVARVRQALSAPRLAPYDLAAGESGIKSLQLYEWNLELSAACHGGLHVVEIGLRNTIHDELTRYHNERGLPGSWTDDPLQELEARRHDDIRWARARLIAQGKPFTPDRIVSELTFGFWRYLLSARYEHSLWTPAIRRGFPHLRPRRRKDLAQAVERLHRLRNRVAHHEPVHRRDAAADHRDMLAVMAAISPQVKGWAEGLNTIPLAVRGKPAFPIPKQRAHIR